MTAALGLASPEVVFKANAESNDMHITARNAELAGHRADLAAACVQCKLIDVLITYCLRRKSYVFAPGLAAFLVALLQPELTEDQIEADVLLVYSSDAAQIVDRSRKVTTSLVGHLSACSNSLWQLLSQVPQWELIYLLVSSIIVRT